MDLEDDVDIDDPDLLDSPHVQAQRLAEIEELTGVVSFGRHAGFSLIEVMVAMAVLVLVLLALMATVGSSQGLRASSGETDEAVSLLRLEQDRYRAMALADVYPSIRDAEPVALPRASRSLPENPRLSGAVLTVEVLTETVTGRELGLPSAPDLDGGRVGSDFAAYSVVPVRLTIAWTSLAGKPRVETTTTVFYPSSTTQ